VNFTKSLAVNDATIAVGGTPVQAQNAASLNSGPAGVAGAVQGIPPDIASIPNIVSPSLRISFSSKS
jgi:hypothetical protein